MLKNGIAKKILFIAIMTIATLILLQGTAMASEVIWDATTVNGELGGYNWDILGSGDDLDDDYSGKNNGVSWETQMTKTDGDDDKTTSGKVILYITGFDGSVDELELPDKIRCKVRKVAKELEPYTYEVENVINLERLSVKKLKLGQYVKELTVPTGGIKIPTIEELILGKSFSQTGLATTVFSAEKRKINKINVDENNEIYSSDENGVLFSKDKKTLYWYPQQKAEKEYVIPDSVEKIDNYAFLDAYNLEKVVIPNGVKSIDVGAFKGCTHINNITIPSSVEDVGASAFEGCTFLRTVEILSNLQVIRERTFSGAICLLEIIIPDTVTEIGDYAFSGCTLLKKVKLPTNLKTISIGAFEKCLALLNIDFPEGLENILPNAFAGTFLSHIEIPQGVKIIGENSFACEYLYTAIIPNTVEEIGKNAFKGNKNLVVYGYGYGENVISELNTKMAEWHTKEAIPAYAVCEGINPNEDDIVDYVEINKFVEGTAIEVGLLSHIYGVPIKVLDEASFKNNEKIQKIKLPNTIEIMWDQVFYGCTSLNNVVLPETIKNIPYRAFANCPSLTKLVIRKGSAIEEIGEEVFLGVNSLIVFHDGDNNAINDYAQNNTNSNVIIKIDNEAPYADTRLVPSDDKTRATLKIENIKDKEGGSGAELFVVTEKENIDEIEVKEWGEVTSDIVLKKVDKNQKYYIYLTDMVGNVLQKPIDVNGLDDKKPEIILDESTITYSRDGAIIQVTFKEEDEGSGLLKWTVSKKENKDEILEDEWKNDISGYEQTVSENLDANGLWYIYVMDKAENINSKLLNITKIDNIAPVIGAVEQNSPKKEYVEATVHLYEEDGIWQSGLVAYAIDTKETIDANTEWIKIDGKPMSKDIEERVEANGKHYVHVKDDYGNVATKGFVTEGIVDFIAPRVKFVDKTNNNIKIKITDAFSGIAEGAKISYGWSTTKAKEPETYKTVELNYEAGAKEVIANVPCDGQGTYYLLLKIEELKDVAGNANTEGKIYSDSYEFDTVAPEITKLVYDTIVLNNGKESRFQLTLSEKVILVETESLYISGEASENCSVSEIRPVSTDGLVWEFVVTGGDVNGEAQIDIPKGIFKDLTGNTLEEDRWIKFTIDNTPPRLSKEIIVNDNILKQGQEATFTLEFPEEVYFYKDKYKEIVSENEKANLKFYMIETLDGVEAYKKWNITFEAGSGDGEVEIQLPKGLFRDELGNEVEPISLGFVRIDNTLPKLEITQLETDDKNENVNMYSTREYMITSDEKVNIKEGKIEIKAVNDTDTITGKVVVEPNGTEGKQWKVTVTEFDGDGLAKLVIPSGYFVDEAENKNSFTEKNIVTVDSTAAIIDTIKAPYLDKENGKAVIEINLKKLNKNLKYVISSNPELLEEDLVNVKDITSNPFKIEIEEAGEYYIHIFDALGNITSLEPIKIEESLFDPLAPVISIEENEQNYIKQGDSITYKIISSEPVDLVEGEYAGMLVGTADDSVLDFKYEDGQWYVVVTAGSKSGDLTLTIPKGFFVNSMGKTNLNEAKVSLNVDNVEPTVNVNEISFDEITKKAKIKISLESAEGKLQYVLSTSDKLENITEEWKEVTTNPFEIETEKAGIYYVYVEEESGHITRSEKINVSGSVFDNVPPTITVEGPEKVSLKNGQTVTYKLIPSEEVRATSDEGPIAKLTGNATDSNFKIYFDTEQKAWLAKITAGEINGDLSLIIPKGYFEDLADNKTQNDIVITGITVDNTVPVITGITEPVLDETKEKAIIEITLENSDEKVEYVISTSDKVENITEEWKQITENPFKIEITKEGTYYVYIRDEAGNIAQSERIEITSQVFDIIPPTAEVKHEIVNGKVKVMIIANEKIQLLDGWNYANANKTIIEKIFEQDTNEKVIVKDLANNSCEKNVTVKLITKITLNKTQLILEKGVSEKLTATIEPESVTNSQLIWTSSNNNVATVDNQGNVTAVSDGTATITVTTLEGNKTQSCQVTVKPEEITVELKDDSKYQINKDGETLYIENIETNTTIEDVLKDIDANADIKVYKEETEQTDKTKKITTGMIIKLTKGEQEKTLVVVVKGDCNGSGTCNVSDLTKLKVSRAESLATNKDETKILTGAFARAMDFNKDGKLSASDITNLCKYIAENK